MSTTNKNLIPSLTEKGLYFFRKNQFLNTKLLVWLVLIYFPIFLNLGGLVMHRWDEARYGVSSWEMLKGDNPWVVTYLNEPCMGTAKPPLMHWLQAISIKFFGLHETAVRLPSALAGVVICMVIMYVSVRKFRSFSFGAISTLILLSGNDIFCGIDHCVRTGDYDALLSMFSFLGVVSFYYYNESPQSKKYLVWTFVFITFAVMTKAVAGLFFVPGMFIYLLIKKNLLTTMKSKWFYFSLAFFVVVLGFIFLIREHYTPGYLQALNDNELMGRHGTVMDGHVGDFWYYLKDLEIRFGWFFWLIPVSWLFGLSSRNAQIRGFSVYTFIISFTFFLVLSSAQSKLYWYSFPLLPVLAIQSGLILWMLLKSLTAWLSEKLHQNKTTLYYLSLVLLFSVPYMTTVGNSNQRVFSEDFIRWNNIEEYCKLERAVMKNSTLVVSPADFQIPYRFYYLKLNELGFNMKYEVGYTGNYQTGEVLVVEGPEYQAQIEQNFETETLDIYNHLKTYRVLGKKSDTIAVNQSQ